MVTRPGNTPPRKPHLWSHYKDAAGMVFFPPVPLGGLAAPTAPLDAARAFLPPLDDTHYRWIRRAAEHGRLSPGGPGRFSPPCEKYAGDHRQSPACATAPRVAR